MRLRYYYFRFLKANGRRTEILIPVSILTFWPPSACDSAFAYQILSKFDDRGRCYDVISIFQDGRYSVVNLLPVSGLAMPDNLRRPKTIGIPNFD